MSSSMPHTQGERKPDYWGWDAQKLGLKEEDIFGDLHLRYNTFSANIQARGAFYCDVWELSRKAANREEFEEMLTERRASRLKELRMTFEQIADYLCPTFGIFPEIPTASGSTHHHNAMDVLFHRSFDSLVKYFGDMIPEEKPKLRRARTPPDDDRPLCPYKSDSDFNYEFPSEDDQSGESDNSGKFVPVYKRKHPRRIVKGPKKAKLCLHLNKDGTYRYLRTQPSATPHGPPPPALRRDPDTAGRAAEKEPLTRVTDVESTDSSTSSESLDRPRKRRRERAAA